MFRSLLFLTAGYQAFGSLHSGYFKTVGSLTGNTLASIMILTCRDLLIALSLISKSSI